MALTLGCVLILGLIIASGVTMLTGWALITGVGVLLLAGHHYGPLVVYGAVAVAVYAVSLRFQEWTRCWLCGGLFRIRGLGMFALTYRRGCRSRWCDGGHRLRWGVRIFRRRRARQLMG